VGGLDGGFDQVIVELSIGGITMGTAFYVFWRMRTKKAELVAHAGERTEKTEESNS
jgi:uncharacterized membrane protein